MTRRTARFRLLLTVLAASLLTQCGKPPELTLTEKALALAKVFETEHP